MKILMTRIFLGLFLILVGVTDAHSDAKALPADNTVVQNVLHLAVGEYPPFVGERLPGNGFFARIVSKAFALEGIKVVYSFMPWARVDQQVIQGKADGTIAYVWTEERAKSYFYSDSVIEEPGVFFHLREHPFEWQDFDDLSGIIIGVSRGTSYGPEFNQAVQRNLLRTFEVNTDLQNLKKLVSKRVELVPLGLIVGYHLLAEHFSDQEIERVTNNPKQYTSPQLDHMYLALTQSAAVNTRNIQKFNRGLKKLKASSDFNKLLPASLQ